MNIHSNLNSIAPIAPDGPSARVGASSSSTSSSNTAAPVIATTTILDQDQTHLSQAGVLVSATSSVSDVRLDKVATIQQALASNSYAVSPSEVAGKLIDHLLQ